jgi:hypothetical protein
MLLLALGVVSLLWAVQERRFYRRALEEDVAPPGRPVDPAASWEKKMALVRRNELFNWVVAISVTAILGGFVWVGTSYYASLRAAASNPDPPEVTVPRRSYPGTGEAAVLRWEARYPGGRLWTAVADGGYVLFRATRGHFDEYFLYGPAGNLIWQGERVDSGPAPRAAIGHRDGNAALAVEEPDGSARFRVFAQDGRVIGESLLPRFPADSDRAFHAIKSSSGGINERWTSPDGQWRALVDLGLSGARVQVFGPVPTP